MREWIHAILPEPPRYTERADQVVVSPVLLCILAFSLGFTAYLSNAVVSGNSPFTFQAGVVLKPLVSLMGHLVACSARISVGTHRQTDSNPRCACAPRVNKVLLFRSIFSSISKFSPYVCTVNLRENACAYFLLPSYTGSKVQEVLLVAIALTKSCVLFSELSKLMISYTLLLTIIIGDNDSSSVADKADPG